MTTNNYKRSLNDMIYEDKHYIVEKDCPVHEGHTATMHQFPHRYAGMFTCIGEISNCCGAEMRESGVCLECKEPASVEAYEDYCPCDGDTDVSEAGYGEDSWNIEICVMCEREIERDHDDFDRSDYERELSL